MPDQRGPLDPDRLTEAVIGEDLTPPALVVLQGYVGRSPEAGRFRLYLTPLLTEYVEIAHDDVLHARKLPEDGGTMVWLSRELDLPRVLTRSERPEDTFLAGDIAFRHLAGASPQMTRDEADQQFGITARCPSITMACLFTPTGK
jgi:hypothetical protein